VTNIIKNFLSVSYPTGNKLERLFLENFNSLVHHLRVKQGAYPQLSSTQVVSGFTRKRWIRLLSPARDKRSSLFGPFVSYKEKKFYKIDSRSEVTMKRNKKTTKVPTKCFSLLAKLGRFRLPNKIDNNNKTG